MEVYFTISNYTFRKTLVEETRDKRLEIRDNNKLSSVKGYSKVVNHYLKEVNQNSQ
jgi:hypothetical protein